MDLTKEYPDIYTLQRVWPQSYNALESWFCGDMATFLEKHCNLEYFRAHAIAEAVFALMSAKGLYYHTPVHVMQMFEFVRLHDIHLEPWEQLALWFHDSIYWPGSGFGPSEAASRQLMVAVLPPPKVLEGHNPYYLLLKRAEDGILATAKHLDDNVNQVYHKILDLDVNTFLATGEMARQVNDCLQKELCPGSPDKWNRGRVNFLEGIVAKGRIFRSQEFQRFDTQALTNVKEQIEEYRRLING